jgi:hypothetical protein
MSWKSNSELKRWSGLAGKKATYPALSKKGDLSRAVEDAVKTWISKKE